MSVLHALSVILSLVWASAANPLDWVPVELHGQDIGDAYFVNRSGVIYTHCNSHTARLFHLAFAEVEEILGVMIERMDTILEAIATDETGYSASHPTSKTISAVRTYSAFINPDLTGTTSAGPETLEHRRGRLMAVKLFRRVAYNIKEALAKKERLQISCNDAWATPFDDAPTRAPKTQRISQLIHSETQSDDRRSKPQPGPGWTYDSRFSLRATGAYSDPNNQWIRTYFRPWRRWPFRHVRRTWWPPIRRGEAARDPPDLGLLTQSGPLWPAVLLQRMRGGYPTVIDIAPMYITGWENYTRIDWSGRAKAQRGMKPLKERYYGRVSQTLEYHRARSSMSESLTRHTTPGTPRPHLLQFDVWRFPPVLLLTNLVQANKFAGFNMTRHHRYGQCSDLPDCPIALSSDTHLLFLMAPSADNHTEKDVQYGNFSRFLLDAQSDRDIPFIMSGGLITAGVERFVFLALALYLDGADWSTGFKGGPWFSPGPAFLGPAAESNDRSVPPDPQVGLWEELRPQGPYPPPFIPQHELRC